MWDIHELIPELYALFDEGQMELEDVSFHYSGQVGEAEWVLRDEFFVISHQAQLRYLEGKYKAKPSDVVQGAWIFDSGCLLYTRPGYVEFRDRSEWFRKLWTDLTFAAEWSGGEEVEVVIPRLWIRQMELPLMSRWFGMSNLHPVHQMVANAMIEGYPLEKVLAMKYKSVQKSMLAYYVQTGELTVDQFWAARRSR